MSILTDDLRNLANWVEGIQRIASVPEGELLQKVSNIMRESAAVLEWQSKTLDRLEEEISGRRPDPKPKTGTLST